MTQEERWMERYSEVKSFIEMNHRNPSRYVAEERGRHLNWLKHNKLYSAGEMKEERVQLLNELLNLCKRHKHKNQYE